MSRIHDTDAEHIRRRLAEIAAMERSHRSIVLRSVFAIAASVAVSLLVMGWGFSMDDLEVGPVVFFSGALLGNAGVLFTLLWAYRASED